MSQLTLVSCRQLGTICVIVGVAVFCLDTNGTALTSVLDDATVAVLGCQRRALSHVAWRAVFRDFNAVPPRRDLPVRDSRHFPGGRRRHEEQQRQQTDNNNGRHV